MANQFKLIAITLPTSFLDEAAVIASMLDCGIDRVHVRKPHWSRDQIALLLRQIPTSMHSRLSLHDCHELINDFPDLWLHANARNPLIAPGITYSRSCHSLTELSADPNCKYSFLSPIFDSVSKAGYTSQFTPQQIARAHRDGIINNSTIALGGITPHNIALIKEWGFGGAAMLGCLWQSDNIDNTIKLCCNL